MKNHGMPSCSKSAYGHYFCLMPAFLVMAFVSMSSVYADGPEEAQMPSESDHPKAMQDEQMHGEGKVDMSDDEEMTEEQKAKMVMASADKAHLDLMLRERYPSATACGECHPTHYREWSISQHAYAQMSPVFNAMQGTLGKITNGTLGDFCIRCHTPVGMNLQEDEFGSNIDRHPTSREGVTCVVCHRIDKNFGKITGRLAIVEGPVTDEVFGPTGANTELERVIQKSGLVTESDKAGRKVHESVGFFAPLKTSAFCGTCHDVTEINGFRLEEAFSEWKNSPAAKLGIRCQDCHMGKEPGKILTEIDDPDFDKKNFAFGPAAKVGSAETKPRKLTNHMFVGPDYSLLPASIFPQNIAAIREEHERNDPKAKGMATIRDWLKFDIDAGWGTDEFEDEVSDDYEFPERWESVDDRYDAREIVNDNIELLEMITEERLKLLRNGYLLGDVVVKRADEKGIKFHVEVKNGTNGHNVPTGFDGERVVWLFVQVKDAEGNLVFESGHLDPNGDVRDLHSAYVHNHELPLDKYLFTLQSRFLTFATRGAEREQVIAAPYSLTVIPFLNKEVRSAVLLGRHFGARKHRKGIEPGGRRWGKYKVHKKQLTGHGPYTATIQLKAAPVPVNLVNAVRKVGFDYGLSARDIADVLVKGHQIVHETTVTFDVHN